MTDQDRSSVADLMLDAGRRMPDFIQEGSTTGLVKAVMRLAMEVSVLRDRMDIYEKLCAEHDITTDQAIETFEADDALSAKRLARRTQLIERLVKDLS